MNHANLFCEVCNISVHTDAVMKEHVRGRKHKKNQDLYERRKELSARSIFTRGFPPKTDEAQLKTYFSQFGEIQRLLFHTGIYAIVEFAEESAVKKIFNQRDHVVGGHRVVIKPRDFKPPTPKLPDKQLPVGGRAKAWITAPPCPMEEAEAKRHLEEFRFNIGTLPEAETLTSLLSKAESIDQQMDMLCKELKLTDEDVQAREKILTSLLDLFLQFYADCEVHVFGSSANGFGTKGCDMDIFLDMKLECRLAEEEKSGVIKYPAQELQLCIDCDCEKCKAKIQPKHRRLVLWGIKSLHGKGFPASAKVLSELTLFDKVKMVSRILSQFEPGCKDAFTVPSIRCPVVRYTHQPTAIKCDVSVNNRLALQNTRLLHLYCQMDTRVRPLVYMVRYWGKLKEVSTNLESGPRLTNYAVTLLVIFYLQNCDPPVVPTVQQLATHDGTTEVVIEGWDCAFSMNWKTPETKINKMTKAELLVGYFQFYSNIDFNSVVLCTRTGQIIPVSDFFNSLNKNDRAKNFKTGPVSVQDPFVLDHNITLNVNDKVRLKLVDELNIAHQLSTRSKESSEGRQELWGLPLLFSEELPPDVASSVMNSSLHSSDGGLEGYVFPLVLKMSLLSESFLKFLHQSPDYRTEWVIVVAKFVKYVLEDVLLFSVTVVWDRAADMQAHACRRAMGNVSLKRDHSDSTSPCGLSTQTQSADDSMDSVRAVGSISVLGSSTDTKTIEEPAVGEPSADVKLEDLNSGRKPMESEACVDSACVWKHESVSVKRLSTDSPLDGPDSVKRCKTVATDSVTSVTPSSSGDVQDNVANGLQAHSGADNCTAPKFRSDLACLRLDCTVKYRTWNGRKPVRRHLVETGVRDSLSLEKSVSEKLRQQDVTASKPVLRFSCEVKAILEPGKTAVLVTLEPGDVGKKEFTSFYPFLRTFVNKTVDKFLGETA